MVDMIAARRALADEDAYNGPMETSEQPSFGALQAELRESAQELAERLSKLSAMLTPILTPLVSPSMKIEGNDTGEDEKQDRALSDLQLLRREMVDRMSKLSRQVNALMARVEL